MASGIIIVDKPSDWTSMDVCAKLRGIFGERRVGHAGTLDPMATGVLPVFVGRATRAVQFAEAGGKEYLATLRLGLVTNTQDIWGEELERRPVPPDAKERLEALLPRFTGDIEQIPPMFSAVKIKGRKLYDLARKGVEVERPPRAVRIDTLELVEGRQGGAALPHGSHEPDTFSLRVRCSKGTYIRTLCHDIGQALGCGGCMAALRRTEACGFSLADAVTLDALRAAPDPAALLRPVDALFAAHPALTVSAQGEQRLRHGAALTLKVPDGTYRVYAPGGAFLLLGEVRGGSLTTRKSFFEI